MVSARQILRSFIFDALRLRTQAAECLREIEADFTARTQTEPERVRRLFQVIHTLKGTASMIAGARGLVQVFQEVEGRLACRALDQSARDPSWVRMADDALVRALGALLELQRKEEAAAKASAPEPASRGVLADLGGDLKKGPGRLWFPMSSVARVLSPGELSGHTVISFQGAWVPVWRPARESLGFGLVVTTVEGSVVVAVNSVVGICSWAEASRQGAKAGLEALLTDGLGSAVRAVA